MNVQDLMTASPATCTPETPLHEIARTMADQDCGAVPVAGDDGAPVGVVTDRDIVVQVLAKGHNPLDKTAADAMTEGAVTVRADASIEEAARLMKERRIRRLVVVDGGGAIAGILAQADLARAGNDAKTGDVVQGISEKGR